MKKIILCYLLLFLSFFLWAKTFEAQLLSVDTALVYREDGTADISLKISWNVSSGAMTSFYFSGEKNPILFNSHKSWAEGLFEGQKQRLALDIFPLATGGYNIVIADGKELAGQLDFVLSYRVNLAAIGHSSLVYKSEDETPNQLFYFNWAPVNWELPFKSRRTQIVFPLSIDDFMLEDSLSLQEKKDVFLEILGLQINALSREANTKIQSSFVLGLDNKSYLALEFFQENPREQESQPISFYFDAKSSILKDRDMVKPSILLDKTESFQFESILEKKEIEQKSFHKNKSFFWLFSFLLIALIIIGLGIAFFLVKKRTEKESIETFHPIEIIFLLDIQIDNFLYLILEALYLNGKIEYLDNEKLQIKIKPSFLDSYERAFLSCFNEEGYLSAYKLQAFYTKGLNKSLETKKNRQLDTVFLQDSLKDLFKELPEGFEPTISYKSKLYDSYTAYWWMFSLYVQSSHKDNLLFYNEIFSTPATKKIYSFFSS